MARTRARCRRSARGSRTGSCRWRKRRNSGAARARRRAEAVSFSGRRRRLRSWRKRSGMAVVHSALAPSGQAIWLDMARRSSRALASQRARKLTTRQVLTDAAIRNAMVMHAAFGGSTNLLLHLPAIAHAAGLRRPTVDDWIDVNHRVPRLVDCAAERSASDRARVPRGRRTGGDAARARAGAARRIGV